VMTIRGLVSKLAAIIAAFFGRHWKKIAGMGFYQITSWLFDNPIWMTAEAIWKEWGVAVVMTIAVLINVGLLINYRRKKVSWNYWNEGLDFLKRKEENIRQNFVRIILTVVVLFSIVLYVPDVIYCLEVLLVGFFVSIFLEIFILLLKCLKIKFWGDVIVFFFLSIFQSAFIATATLRKDYSNGLDKRTYSIFAASVVVSVGYWAIRNGIIVETARFLLEH